METQQVCVGTFAVLGEWCPTVPGQSPLKTVKQQKYNVHATEQPFLHYLPAMNTSSGLTDEALTRTNTSLAATMVGDRALLVSTKSSTVLYE